MSVEPDLASLGWDDRFAEAFRPWSAACVPARVARDDGARYDVLGAPGFVHASPTPDMRRDRAALPAVGDWVALGRDTGAIAAVLPRRSAFTRKDPGAATVSQVLAANIDVAFLLHPLTRTVRVQRLELYLVLAWESGALPVVVLTKADLAGAPEDAVAEVESVALGVDVLVASGTTGAGVADVRKRLDGGTGVMLGESGVGKSTLLNSLAGAEVVRTAAIRRDGEGRHTTAWRELVPLPGGGVVIDTPGLRRVLVWDADEGVSQAFADVEEFATGCRFRDCAHSGEPGCAVAAAITDGSLPARRFASYQKVQRELAWLERRNDARLRAEAARRWKVIHKQMRGVGRQR